MFGFLKFLKPVGVFVLKTVVREVFNAEFLFGSNKGKDKLKYVIDRVEGVLDDEKKSKSIATDLVELINAVVEVLNQLGLLDDTPGMDIGDFEALLDAVLNLIKEISEFMQNFD